MSECKDCDKLLRLVERLARRVQRAEAEAKRLAAEMRGRKL